jgi:iron complex outermembrane receptor protein
MKPRISPIARSLAVAFGGMAALLPASEALAQQQLERVEITGSRIKRIDAETAAPVEVITRQDIEQSGKQTIQEVLRGITADGVGSIPTSFTNGFASGSAAVSLRGLGVNSTLVLLNGRRMTTYGLADDGTRNFVDLNTLPLEAVERIEVLKDGASAIYGADAVGGVVNVILRKNYTGASIGASYGQTGESDGKQTKVFGSVGVGNLDTDKYNAFLTLEASKTKHILSVDRGFIGQNDLSPYGYYDTTNGAMRPYFGLGPTSVSPYGVVRDPVTNARTNVIPCDPSIQDPVTHLCRFNSFFNQEVQPETERLNLFGKGTMVFSPTLTGYTELGYFRTKSKAHGSLGGDYDNGVWSGNVFDPVVFHDPPTLPGSHPDNPFPGTDLPNFFYRPFEVGGGTGSDNRGRGQETTNEVFRGLVGLQGNAYGWDWDSGLLYTKSKLKNLNFGFLVHDNMVTALNNGTWRINLPNTTDPAVLAFISPTLENDPTSSVTSIDFKAARDVMTLAGGPMGLALGAEYRQEKANTPAVPGTDTGQIIGLGFSAFDMSRNVWALYGELVAPVTKWLELNAALRYDDYSDFGGTWNPKLGFKAKATDKFVVRGTYSSAFRAPGPAEVGGTSFGFTGYGILSLGNPDIQPEKAKSYTLGLVFEPVVGSALTLDYWKIDRKNEILQADPANIIGDAPLTGGAPNSVVPGAIPNSFIYYDSTGRLVTVQGSFKNASKTVTDGFDFSAQGRTSLNEAGRLSGQIYWTHVNKFERTDDLGETKDYAGTHGPLVQSAGGGSPKDRATLTLTWDRGPFAASLGINYVGPIKIVDSNKDVTEPDGTGTMTNVNSGVSYPDSGQYGCGAYDVNGTPWNGNCKLPSFTTFDLYGKWTVIKGLDINLSIQNLFNKEAPLDPYLTLTYGINYNQTWHQAGAVGRFYTLGARYSF